VSKDKNILKNIGLSFIYKPIGILISLALIPLTVKYLGNTLYGLWATILSIVSWMNYFDIGIGNGLRNHLAREITLENFKESRSYISTAYIVVSLISGILFVVLSILFYFLDWNSLFNTKVLEKEELLLVMGVTLLFLSLNFILKIITTIYYSLQKPSMIGLMQIFNQLLNLIGIYLLTKSSIANKLLMVTVTYGLSTLLVNITFSTIFFIKNIELSPKWNYFELNKVKSLTGLGVKFFIIQIAALIIFTTDNLIITKLFGPEEVTPYSVTFKVFSIGIMIHGIIITPLWSAFTKAYTEKDFKWIKVAVKKLNLLQLLIVLGSGTLTLVFPYIIKIWIGNMDIPRIIIIMFAFYVVLSTYCNIYAYFFNGIGEVDFQLKIAIIQGVLNIPLSIFLAKVLELGVTGVILATNLTLLLAALSYPFKFRKLIKELEERDEKETINYSNNSLL